MSTDTKPAKQRSYEMEDVERGLQTLARVISANVASELTGIPAETLRYWRRNTHAARFHEIESAIKTDVSERMASEAERAAVEQGEVAFQLLDHLRGRIGQMNGTEAAKTLRDLETAKAINIDKALLLRGRPTQITEHRSANEVLDSLKRRFPQGIVDADAEEIEDAEAIDTDSAPSSQAIAAR